jgi:ketosteroid isomerase-like protein
VQRNPTQTVQELYDAFGRRDLPKVFSLLSPDIEIVQSEEVPWGGLYRGHDGARQFFGKLGSHINSTLNLERLISAGDHVVAIGWTHGTVNATGASYRVPIAHVWSVRHGLVMQTQFFIDHPTMLEALRPNRA